MRFSLLATIVTFAIALLLALSSQNLPKIAPLFDRELQNRSPLGIPPSPGHDPLLPRSTITNSHCTVPGPRQSVLRLITLEYQPRELAGRSYSPDHFEPDRIWQTNHSFSHRHKKNITFLHCLTKKNLILAVFETAILQDVNMMVDSWIFIVISLLIRSQAP